jgi:hypothetical protein
MPEMNIQGELLAVLTTVISASAYQTFDMEEIILACVSFEFALGKCISSLCVAMLFLLGVSKLERRCYEHVYIKGYVRLPCMRTRTTIEVPYIYPHIC